MIIPFTSPSQLSLTMRVISPKPTLILLAGFLALGLSACSYLPDSKPPADPDDKMAKNYEKTGGSVLGTQGWNPFADDKKDSSSAGVAVNAFLWRAALDTLSFMPMAQVDPFGGVIITEWHSLAESPNERYKINAYILDQELRATGIRVSVFKQKKLEKGNWEDTPVLDNMASRIEESILTRARQLKIAATAPTK